MKHVAINSRTAAPVGMTLTYSPDRAEQKLTAEALRNLREAARPKVYQPAIAEALGISTQAWQKHEAGERGFTAEKIETALEVIGASHADLEAEKARILGRPAPSTPDRRGDFSIEVFGRTRVGGQGPEAYDLAEPSRRVDLRQLLGRNVGAVEVAGDSVSPWAESGELVLFDRDRAPRRGKGCVVELVTGEACVRLYEKSDGSTLFVRELFPEDRTTTFELRQVRGVYPVILRGD